LDMFGPTGLTTQRPRLMQQALVAAGREILILQLHRTRFIQALNGPETFTSKHQYAPSVVATVTSACRLIDMLETFLETAPELCKRVFGFWFNMFSGALAIALYVSRAPHVADASTALRQMQVAHTLFSRVAENNPRAQRAHVLLLKLTDKITRIIADHHDSIRHTRNGLGGLQSQSGRSQPTTSNTRSHMEPELVLDSFEGAHPFLRNYPRQSQYSEVPESTLLFPGLAFRLKEEELRAVSFTSPVYKANTPTRVGNQDLNFDFGALTLGPDDSALMTWF